MWSQDMMGFILFLVLVGKKILYSKKSAPTCLFLLDEHLSKK